MTKQSGFVVFRRQCLHMLPTMLYQTYPSNTQLLLSRHDHDFVKCSNHNPLNAQLLNNACSPDSPLERSNS